jgi:hypothetical protein
MLSPWSRIPEKLIRDGQVNKLTLFSYPNTHCCVLKNLPFFSIAVYMKTLHIIVRIFL